ncbi:hypothetical protein BDN72DRAFT_304709 [Pluteus cervinus]|uniref:Uncharacterized protein n=1 Tax=Pluteus cervinus TaxID=181527 RepID=A0ACD3B4S6_9AGAR|nr:hypothetical protein BDN72DRAFT_304709 [Pluteus cervinus]
MAPSLHILKLNKCSEFNFGGFLALSQLTELSLFRPIPKPSFRQLLVGLGSLPQLRSLTLVDVLNEPRPLNSELLPHINLPALRSITIQKCLMTHISYLLYHIIVDPVTDVVTYIHRGGPHLQSPHGLLIFLNTLNPPLSTFPKLSSDSP